MRLYVKTLTGKTIEINVSEDAGIRHIKWEIERKEGIPSSHQRYIYAGKGLECQRLISDYDIEEDCTLHLVLRLRASNVDPETDQIEVYIPGEKVNPRIWLEYESIDTIEK